MKGKKIFKFILLIAYINVFSQDSHKYSNTEEDTVSLKMEKLLFLNGIVLNGKLIDSTSQELTFKTFKKNGKEKLLKIETERVFSVIKKNGNEIIYYKPFKSDSDFYTKEEMRYFIKGEQDAINGYNSTFTAIFGFGICGTLGYLNYDNLLVVSTPLLYMLFSTMPRITIPVNAVSNIKYLEHDTYKSGFIRVARAKRVQNALIGSISGLIIGVATGWIVK